MSRKKTLQRLTAMAMLFVFAANQWPIPIANAQQVYLPSPGQMVSLSPAYHPAVLKGIKLDPKNPWKFHFLVDKGAPVKSPKGDHGAGIDHRSETRDFKNEVNRLIKYFFASLTVPQEDLWVNLSPYEKNRIIPALFGKTEMGRDLLAQDYILKQITASLIYPEEETGKKFWKRIYEEAARRYGTTNIPVNTFNKVWIVPERAVVYENLQGSQDLRLKSPVTSHQSQEVVAYVVESKLKVMLEEDYVALSKQKDSAKSLVTARGVALSRAESRVIARNLAISKNGGVAEAAASPARAVYEHDGETRGQATDIKQVSPTDLPTADQGVGVNPKTQERTNALGSQIIREIVIPALEKEVNEGANFAPLRQVFHSLILATWYKKKIRDSILARVYADKNKIAGIGYQDTIKTRNPKHETNSKHLMIKRPRRLGHSDLEHLNLVSPVLADRPGNLEFRVSDLNPQQIYDNYLTAFKKGVYNFIKEDSDPLTQQPIPRKYFSGGVVGSFRDDHALVTVDRAHISSIQRYALSQDQDRMMEAKVSVVPQGVGSVDVANRTVIISSKDIHPEWKRNLLILEEGRRYEIDQEYTKLINALIGSKQFMIENRLAHFLRYLALSDTPIYLGLWHRLSQENRSGKIYYSSGGKQYIMEVEDAAPIEAVLNKIVAGEFDLNEVILDFYILNVARINNLTYTPIKEKDLFKNRKRTFILANTAVNQALSPTVPVSPAAEVQANELPTRPSLKSRGDGLVNQVHSGVMFGPSILLTSENINNIVNGPLQQAVRHLYDLNIMTHMSSASAGNVGGEAYISILVSSLSEENQEIARRLGSELKDGELYQPERIWLTYPVNAQTTQNEVQDHFNKVVKNFKPQRFIGASFAKEVTENPYSVMNGDAQPRYFSSKTGLYYFYKEHQLKDEEAFDKGLSSKAVLLAPSSQSPVDAPKEDGANDTKNTIFQERVDKAQEIINLLEEWKNELQHFKSYYNQPHKTGKAGLSIGGLTHIFPTSFIWDRIAAILIFLRRDLNRDEWFTLRQSFIDLKRELTYYSDKRNKWSLEWGALKIVSQKRNNPKQTDNFGSFANSIQNGLLDDDFFKRLKIVHDSFEEKWPRIVGLFNEICPKGMLIIDVAMITDENEQSKHFGTLKAPWPREKAVERIKGFFNQADDKLKDTVIFGVFAFTPDNKVAWKYRMAYKGAKGGAHPEMAKELGFPSFFASFPMVSVQVHYDKQGKPKHLVLIPGAYVRGMGLFKDKDVPEFYGLEPTDIPDHFDNASPKFDTFLKKQIYLTAQLLKEVAPQLASVEVMVDMVFKPKEITLDKFLEENQSLENFNVLDSVPVSGADGSMNSQIQGNAPKDHASREGGINLNPDNMDLQIKGRQEPLSFFYNSRTMDSAQVAGISFTIQDITPVTDLPSILGLKL